MKSLFSVCVLGALIAARPAVAGYSEGLLRQQREWRETERHFSSMAPQPKYVSPYKFGTPYQPPQETTRPNADWRNSSSPRRAIEPQISTTATDKLAWDIAERAIATYRAAKIDTPTDTEYYKKAIAQMEAAQLQLLQLP
jgi:hypothetical protein